MSNGVGVIAALTGSLPRIAPSLNPDLDEGVRPSDSSRDSDAVAIRRRPGRGAPPAVSSRSVGETTSTSGLRLRPTPTVAAGKPIATDPSAKNVPLPADSLRRIADAGKVAQARGASSLRLTLRPAHLGSLTIELSMRGARLFGRIRTETDAARDLIRGHLNRLRESLEERGIRVGDLEVQVGSRPRRPAEEGLSRDGEPEEAEAAVSRSVRRRKLDILA